MSPDGYEPVSHPPIKLRVYGERKTKIHKDVYDTLNLEPGAELHLQPIGVKWPNKEPKKEEPHHHEEEAEEPEETLEEPSRITSAEEGLKKLEEAGVSDGAILTLQEIAKNGSSV